MLANLLLKMDEIILFGLFGFIAGIVRTLFMKEKRSIRHYALNLFISVPCSIVVGFICKEYDLGDGVSFAFASLSGIIAHDFIQDIIENKGYVKRIIKLIFGKIGEKSYDENEK
jgi:hypothetical protein